MMEIREYQEQVDHWIRTYGVRYFNELTNMAILCEETGEVARLIVRMYGEQSFQQALPAEQAKIALADELADVLFVVACLANQTGIDLEESLHRNFSKKTSRDSERHQNNPKIN